jgi:hypothetical protein
MWPFENKGEPHVGAGQQARLQQMQQMQQMGNGTSGPLNGLYGGPLSGMSIHTQQHQQPGLYIDPYTIIQLQNYKEMEAWLNEVHPEVMEEYRAIEALKKSVDEAESHTV